MTVAYRCDRCGELQPEPALILTIQRVADVRRASAEAEVRNPMSFHLFGGGPPPSTTLHFCPTCEGQLREFMAGTPLHADWLEPARPARDTRVENVPPHLRPPDGNTA